VNRLALTLAAAAVGALTLAIPATTPAQDAPPTRPAPGTPGAQPQDDGDDRPSMRRYEGRGYEGYGGGGYGGYMRPPRMEWRRGDLRPELFNEPTAEEWVQIETFMKQHSPRRLEQLGDVGDEQRLQGLRNMFAARYRAMQELKEHDPELYKVRAERMKAEDEAFRLSWDLTHDRSKAPDKDREVLRKQLRVLVESQLQEQALRLKRLETLLEQGRARLKENSTPEHIDAAVEGNLEDLAEDRLPRVLRPQSQRRERRGEDDDRRETEERP
jgi:hypothetical protein